MCGIFGLIGSADAELGERLAECLRHRGPDDHGVWTYPPPPSAPSTAPRSAHASHAPTGEGRGGGETPVTLVNTRLAIIDLSPLGHMPMLTASGRTVIAYNGEVFNFADVRAELLKRGHTFRSNSDTEVIANAYEAWGDECLHRFRGMFAFLIWDIPRQRLFAARDRLGIKPLFWAETPRGLVLGSELKAMLASGCVRPALNLEALNHYLAFYAVPAPLTMLAGVHALPPGHSLSWEAASKRVTVARYWDMPPARPLRADETEIRGELRRLLEESIRLRMIADVPVGAFLSGGVDSSAVVGLMTRIAGEQLKTFSIGFEPEGRHLDERSYAQIVARRYNTEHTEVIVTGRQVADELARIIAAMDQPSGDGLNTYLVSQATAKHVKVALSGLGGDELFAGYPQFKLLKRAADYDPLWQALPNPMRAFLAVGARTVSQAVRRPAIGNALAFAQDDFLGRYGRTRILFNEEAKTHLLTATARGDLGHAVPSLTLLEAWVRADEPEIIDRITRLELKNYMAHTLLRDTDAMSMAHSLEVRVPLIDHKLVEFVTTIPAGLRLRGGQPKYLLTQALADVLPADVIQRRKQGFEMPVAAWLRGPLRPALDSVFSSRALQQRGLFNPAEAQRLYQEFQQGQGPYMRVWAIAALELWLRKFLN
ncbi:MAG: asparagine synthase (glutamine-hydrolyzing) [Chloroflexi bacterium]|nr:asparagine synthase (glutamine-hydrolyzing) [Chloroflexota bacterium]